MKLLSTLLKEIATVGLAPHQHIINVRSLFSFILNGFAISISCIYFFCNAKTFQEHAESIFIIVAIVGITSLFLIFLMIKKDFFNLLNEAEQIIGGSKFHNHSKKKFFFFSKFSKNRKLSKIP